MDDKGNIVIYQTEDGNTKIDVRFEPKLPPNYTKVQDGESTPMNS